MASIAVPVVAAPPAGAAGPTLGPKAVSVAVGGTVEVAPTGCTDSTGTRSLSVEVGLVVGTGPDARLAATHRHAEFGGSLTVPGWVDPALPARLIGWCLNGHGAGSSILITYPKVPIDVTRAAAGGGTRFNPVVRLARASLAGGRVLVVEGDGCGPSPTVLVEVIAGGGAHVDGPTRVVASATVTPGGAGPFRAEIPLLVDEAFSSGASSAGDLAVGGPALPAGSYAVVARCVDLMGSSAAASVLMPLELIGTSPSSDISIERVADGVLALAGSRCGPGAPIRAAFDGFAYDDDRLGEPLSSAPTSRADSLGPRVAPGYEGIFHELVETRADAGGAWSVTWTPPVEGYQVSISVSCGDPTSDGFRYSLVRASVEVNADISVARVSPTSSPAGGPVTVHVVGGCNGAAEVELYDADGIVRSRAPLPPIGYGPGGVYREGSTVVTAPSDAGTFGVRGACDGRPGAGIRHEVFRPDLLADPAPLPAEPAAGWPDAGRRETFHGRSGPITLDPQILGDGGPPSIVVPDLPRPKGDVAITAVRLDVIDEAGRSVPQDEVQLRDILVVDPAVPSPSCPGGTFLLPGEPVLAGGADRSSYSLPDPYAVVAPAGRPWIAGYDVRNRTDRPRTVYLTYDLDLRRDIENVRPVRRYLGSATGCETFTWNIDGSGEPDTQSTFVEIAGDGRLVHAIGFQGSGGLHADLLDDRGRRLCRSEPRVADRSGPAAAETADAPGTTDPPADPSPTTEPRPQDPVFAPGAPATYPDDPDLLGSTACDLSERVRAGERLRFDVTYADDRPRSGVMGIYAFFVWEGGGPAGPGTAAPPPAVAVPGRPGYTG